MKKTISHCSFSSAVGIAIIPPAFSQSNMTTYLNALNV